jgi:hypothetical protein
MCEEKEHSPWAGREYGPWMGPIPWMYGPWMRHGMWKGSGPRICPCCGREIQPPTTAERIERLEAYKKRLEERLSRINEKIEELKKEEKP